MFGHKLKTLREHKYLAQGTVAQKLNLTQATYSRYESDIHQPDFITLRRIANFFNVSIDYLLDNEKNISTVDNFIDLKSFINNGNYTINSRLPSAKERRMLSQMIDVICDDKDFKQ